MEHIGTYDEAFGPSNPHSLSGTWDRNTEWVDEPTHNDHDLDVVLAFTGGDQEAAADVFARIVDMVAA